MAQAVNHLRQKFQEYPGAQIAIKEFEQGPPVEAPIEIRLMGDNLPELTRIAKDTERIFRKTAGTINIDNPLRTSKTDLRVNINREKAGLLGVPLIDIDRTVRMAIAGLPVATYREPKVMNIRL
ncbi:MAG: efflux RND transporter permease subunit [Gemmatimonadetes bacterium]|nr:MAG: efflux RND transporter permease subunit [Gemmatimonadota bacterium]